MSIVPSYYEVGRIHNKDLNDKMGKRIFNMWYKGVKKEDLDKINTVKSYMDKIEAK